MDTGKIEIHPEYNNQEHKLIVSVAIALIRGFATTITYLRKALKGERL